VDKLLINRTSIKRVNTNVHVRVRARARMCHSLINSIDCRRRVMIKNVKACLISDLLQFY